MTETCPVCHSFMAKTAWLCSRWDDRSVHLRGYRRDEWPKVEAVAR